jgi:Na+-driven multidrug efflux pump
MPKTEELLQGNLGRAFFHYLVTSVAGMLIFAFYVLVDTLFIGRILGSEGLAALNIALPIFGLLTGVGLLLGVGGAAAMSVSLGENNQREVTALFSTAVTLGIISVITITFVGVAFQRDLINFLGGSGVNTPMVRHYILPVVIFSFSFIFTQLLTPFIRHDGAPVLAMWSTIIGGLTNIVLDALFMVVFRWGMLGASLATIVASLVSLTLLIRHLPRSTLLRFKGGQVSWQRVKRIILNGGASLVMELSSGVVMFSFNRVLLGSLGELGVAAYGVIANYSLIALAIFSGVGQAVQPISSINYGAGQVQRARQARNFALGISLALGILFYGIGLAFPRALTFFFVQATPELLAISVYGIRLYFLAFLFAGLNVTMGAYFQSIELRQRSLSISLLRGFVLIVTGLVVWPRWFGLAGVWITVPVAELGTLFYVLVKEREASRLGNLAYGWAGDRS